MNKKELICIVCPNGCPLEAEIEEGDGVEVGEVTGSLCEKGPVWAQQELTNPVRTIASNVLVAGGDFDLVSVRTDAAIPLGKIMDVMADVKKIQIAAPVRIGDVLIKNPAGTSCNIIATRHVNVI
jgi:CxxC motif-containing protein